MKTQLNFKPNITTQSNCIEDRSPALNLLDNALERSAHELILLASFYQKHGYLRQAQDIYYFILSIQERRDRRRWLLQAEHTQIQPQQGAFDQKPKIEYCCRQNRISAETGTSADRTCEKIVSSQAD